MYQRVDGLTFPFCTTDCGTLQCFPARAPTPAARAHRVYRSLCTKILRTSTDPDRHDHNNDDDDVQLSLFCTTDYGALHSFPARATTPTNVTHRFYR